VRETRCGRSGATSGDVIKALKRQAPVIAIALAAAGFAAGAATADPSISAKQAEAQQVMVQIQRLDSSLQRARSAYESATFKLHAIQHNLKINRVGLRVAHANLITAQKTLAQRLVTIYTTSDSQSTLAVLLGATSVDDLVSRIESVQSFSAQDVAIVKQVVAFKRAVTVHQHLLVRERHAQVDLVRQRAAARARISTQLVRSQRLYSSIKGEIARMVAAQRARQLALARAARSRLAAYQVQQASNLSVGGLGTDPGYSAPPSQYTGVVGIAMQFLGTPYVWGGASPGGFDCSGLVMYVYAQVGVSLPHYTGAQWLAGVPVSRSDLQPGDLVFFDGLGHVGIYIGGNEFIHAPHTGDVVKIDSLSESWYAATYDGARRITGG
jgi:cell wall-associated NlpC family hydrolase